MKDNQIEDYHMKKLTAYLTKISYQQMIPTSYSETLTAPWYKLLHTKYHATSQPTNLYYSWSRYPTAESQTVFHQLHDSYSIKIPYCSISNSFLSTSWLIQFQHPYYVPSSTSLVETITTRPERINFIDNSLQKVSLAWK